MQSTKNYFEQATNRLVLGGAVAFAPGVDVENPDLIFGASAKAVRYVQVPLIAATVTTAGAVLAWQNPEGVPLLLLRPIVRIATASTGAATVDIGTAANGTTAGDNLFDGLDVNAALGLFEAPSGAGPNDAAVRELAAGAFVTGTASATLAGLVASIIIPYVKLG